MKCLHNGQVTKLFFVTWNFPLTVLNHVSDLLVQVWSGLGNVVDSQLVEWSGTFNVLEGNLQLLDLFENGLLGQLGVFNGLFFKDFNVLQVLGNIVGDWLEALDGLFNFVNDLGVLQHRSVVVEVDFGRLFREGKVLLLGFIVSLLERSQGSSSRAGQSQRRDDLGPIQLGGNGFSNRRH